MFYGFSEERSQFFRTVKMYLGGVDGCAYQLKKLLHVSHQKLMPYISQFSVFPGAAGEHASHSSPPEPPPLPL